MCASIDAEVRLKLGIPAPGMSPNIEQEPEPKAAKARG
jgi:hypothetical protein